MRRHAALMLESLARDGRLPAAQPEPMQVWRFGRDLTLVALGGEVVVDYALRLARDYPAAALGGRLQQRRLRLRALAPRAATKAATRAAAR